MTERPNDWDRVQTVFAAALERAPADRGRWLDEACGAEPMVREEVEALLVSHDRADQFLGLDAEPASPSATIDALAGLRIGPFALVREIGRGGMSVVYLAERVDGGFAQQVAVKILDAPLRVVDVRQRFLAERQILARFAHPNIVSFLDAGVTADGRPYLVMERIDGRPLTRYCAERRLDLPARLALLAQLCRALQYAHQHGVVHRDLKPANLLVTPDGVVKVLDFGIAKLLDDSVVGSGDATLAGASRALTPNYASPEQLRGETVTTATDIYTIGVVMYEVLSGRRPYETGERTLGEIVTLVANTDPVKPSEGAADAARPYSARALHGDLDAIVRKAMAPEPADRYASAQQIADDLVRHDAGEPIEARRVSMTYVLTRLARRHRAAVIAFTVSVLALVVALGVSLWEIRAARLERDRAQRRFDDARDLARSLIFKVHDAVQPLPGSTPVRRLIVADALTYLERLSQDPSGDDALRLELARGYHRVADVQGLPSVPNLGDRAAAESSYRKALALLRPIAKGPLAREATLELGRIDLSLATLHGANNGSDQAAINAINEALTVGTRLLAAHEDDEQAQRLVASAHFRLAETAPHDEALAQWTKTGALFDALLAKKPGDPDRQRNVALVEKYIGNYYEEEKAYSTALPHFVRALEIDRQRLGRQPNRDAKFDVAVDLSNVAVAESHDGRTSEAIEHLSQCLAIREELSAADPEDVLARNRLAFTYRRLGAIYHDAGRLKDALDVARKSVAIYEEIAPLDAQGRRELSNGLSLLAGVERDVAMRLEACRDFRRAATLTDALLAEHALPLMTARMDDERRYLRKELAGCGPRR